MILKKVLQPYHQRMLLFCFYSRFYCLLPLQQSSVFNFGLQCIFSKVSLNNAIRFRKLPFVSYLLSAVLQCVLQMERRNSFARAEFETEVDICKNRQLINRPKSNLTGVQITIAEAVSSANWIRKLVKLSESRESFFALAQFKKRKVKRVWTICEKTLVEKLWMCHVPFCRA